MKKKSDRAKAKDKAWEAFSRYIRLRDCLRFMNDHERGMCVTCKREKPFKLLQAGHFVVGRGNAVLFDERLVYSQCAGCNLNPPFGLGGNHARYTLFMIDEWGLEKTEEFLNLKNTEKIYKLHDFLEIRETYETKYKELLNA